MVTQTFFDIDFRQDNASGIWIADFHLGPQDIELPENLKYCISRIEVDTFVGYDNKTYWRMLIKFDKDKVFYLNWKKAKWIYVAENDISQDTRMNMPHYKYEKEWQKGSLENRTREGDIVIAYLATEYFEEDSNVFFIQDTCLTKKTLTT